MSLPRTRKIFFVILLLYWPLICILTHIPLRREFLEQLQASDKTLHFLVYFILSFLLYFAAEPSVKLSLKSRKLWLLFATLFFYAAADEWLQGIVGRSCDFLDFVANLAGVAVAFILLSFLSFQPALLVFTAISIILTTKAAQMRFIGELSFIRPAVYFLGYAFFTIIWSRFICMVESLQSSKLKQLLASFSLPLILLLAAGIFSFFLANSFQLPEIICSLAAIFTGAAISHFIKKFV